MGVKKVRKLLVTPREPDVVERRRQNDKRNWEAMRKLGETSSTMPSIGVIKGTPEAAEADAQTRYLDERLQKQFGAYKGDERLGHYRLSGGPIIPIEDDEGVTGDLFMT